MMRSMDKTPLKLTVIVPVYKTEPYLRRCIDSILGQTLTDFELILVDDGSPDNCPTICDEYAKADERVRVIHKENGGLALVRKVGVSLANGEYIAFVNSDDWIEPEMYEILYRIAEDNACDMVICDWTHHYLETHTTAVYTQSHTIKENHLYDSGEIQEHLLSKVLLEELHGYTWNKLYRSSILKQCNLDRTVGLQNSQDWVLNCEYFKKIHRMMYINKCLYNYAIHSSHAFRTDRRDYLSIILRLQSHRMHYLKEYGLDGRDDVLHNCINRFMIDVVFCAYEYTFFFKDTKVAERIRQISEVVNNEEIRRCMASYWNVIRKPSILSKIKFILIRLRMPLLIYGFPKGLRMAIGFKRTMKRWLVRRNVYS